MPHEIVLRIRVDTPAPNAPATVVPGLAAPNAPAALAAADEDDAAPVMLIDPQSAGVTLEQPSPSP